METPAEKATKSSDPRAAILDAINEMEEAQKAAKIADMRVAKAKNALKKTRSKIAIILGEWILDGLKTGNAETLNALHRLNTLHKIEDKDFKAIEPWFKAMKITFPTDPPSKPEITKRQPAELIQPQKPQAATMATMATKIQPQMTIKQTVENRPIPGAR